MLQRVAKIFVILNVAACLLAPLIALILVVLAQSHYIIWYADGRNVGFRYDGRFTLRIKSFGPDLDTDATGFLPIMLATVFAVPPLFWLLTHRQATRASDGKRLVDFCIAAPLALGLALLMLNIEAFCTCTIPVAIATGAIAGVIKIAGGLRAPAQRRLAVRLAQGLCGNCGYDCRATPERCPECGTLASDYGRRV